MGTKIYWDRSVMTFDVLALDLVSIALMTLLVIAVDICRNAMTTNTPVAPAIAVLIPKAQVAAESILIPPLHGMGFDDNSR